MSAKLMLVALYDYHSHGIRGLHSFLASRGHNVSSFYFKYSTYCDYMCHPAEVDGFLSTIKEIAPDIIGFGVRSPLFPLFAKLSSAIRANFPNIKIVAGGPHATAAPETCEPHADYVVRGDGELAMLDILNGCNHGVVNGKRIENLDALPFEHYGENTYTTQRGEEPMVKVSAYTSRGCFFGCAYCQESVLRRKPVRKSVARFKYEVEYLKTVFNEMRIITIADPIFLCDMEWMEEFASAFSGSGLKFWCAGHAGIITDDMLKLAKAAGVVNVRIGVQSGSDWVRESVYNRKDSLDDVLRVSELLVKNQILGNYDFIIESPYDTPETLADTRRFIAKLPSQSLINKFELRFWPGTPITERAIKDGYILPEEVEGNFLRFGGWTYVYQAVR